LPLGKTASVRISAAALGVAARKSAAKSLMVKSISCPMAETTGRAEWKIARATGLPEESFCMACYNSKYPVPYDAEMDKHIMNRRRARIEGLMDGLEKDAMQIKLL
jgi:hypothetical protein